MTLNFGLSGSLRDLASAIVVLFTLSACEQVSNQAKPLTSTGRSAESLRLETYYGSVQARLRQQGLLRTDGGGPDVPFTTRTLVEDFEHIALYDEYTIKNGRFVAQKTPAQYTQRRWYAVYFEVVPLILRKRVAFDIRSVIGQILESFRIGTLPCVALGGRVFPQNGGHPIIR